MPGIFGILAKRPDLSRKELGDLGRRMADAMQTGPWLLSELCQVPDTWGVHRHTCGCMSPAAAASRG